MCKYAMENKGVVKSRVDDLVFVMLRISLSKDENRMR